MLTVATRRRSIPNGLRWRIFERDRWACRYCGSGWPTVRLHIDHIEPLASGGSALSESNLVTSCSDCNLSKGTRAVEFGDPGDLPRVILSAARATEELSYQVFNIAYEMSMGPNLDLRAELGWTLTSIGPVDAFFHLLEVDVRTDDLQDRYLETRLRLVQEVTAWIGDPSRFELEAFENLASDFQEAIEAKLANP